MKILVHDYSGHPFQIQLSKYFAQQNNDTIHVYSQSFITPKGNLNQIDNLTVEGIDVGKYNKYGVFTRLYYEWKYAACLKRVIKKHSPDIVISSNMPIFFQRAVQKYALKLGCKFIHWWQDIYSVAINKELKSRFGVIGRLLSLHFFNLEKWCTKKAHHIVAISDDFKEYIHTWKVQTPFSVIENWAPLNEIEQKSKANEWSKERNLDKSFNFLYSGTLGLKHNPQILIDLSHHFCQHSDVVIVVVSEGKGREYIDAKIKEQKITNIKTFDYIPFSEMSNLLSMSDVLIALLEDDAGTFSVPSKVLTYHCAGKPLLLSVPKINLASKIVERNHTGLVNPPNSTYDFLEAANQLYSNNELSKKFGENARGYAEATFNINLIGEQFYSIIKEIL